MNDHDIEKHRMVRAAVQNRLSLLQKDRTAPSLELSEIEVAVAAMTRVFGVEDSVNQNLMVAELEQIFQTRMGTSRVLVGHDDSYSPWLAKRKAEIKWPFWERYEQYLLEEAGRSQVALDRLDESTDEVLDLLTAPDREGGWDRRGLIVGHVQSGKTSHYTGLICKAADAGYKLIVVLAGFHKSLRSQTQIRLEEGFLGYDRAEVVRAGSSAAILVGVGRINPSPRADSITTRADDGDFKRAVARQFGIKPGGNPLLFVVKKNGSVLRNLLKWVESVTATTDDKGRPYVRDVPMLVIDDEADQGSIDTKVGAIDENGSPDEDHDPTVLNQRIRRLLHLFEQSAYVGYTATPFANILVHESARTEREGEDLFPRSFIISLPTPSNYVGPATIFGFENEDGDLQSGLPIVQHIEDHADSLALNESKGWMPPRHSKHHIPRYLDKEALPPSLSRAIRGFILGCAARIARGHRSAHSSMLVHVTRFTAVQARIAEQIRDELANLRRRWKYGDGESQSQLRVDLRSQWEEEYMTASKEVIERAGKFAGQQQAWTEIEPHIDSALFSVQVRVINGLAGDVLDYMKHSESGLNVIAVGGDKLSRGLTLEGLTVSYFLRASRMYDTLMQMGRWFGYRPGYLDLCRLYTTPELTDWFFHIASASEELRGDFNCMVAGGGTPRDFGHRVRSHPLMMVTSQVKRRHSSTIAISFEGDISETINFWRSKGKLEHNWKAAEQLATALRQRNNEPRKRQGTGSHSWVWNQVETHLILDFLSGYQEHSASKKVKTKLLADYIRMESQKSRLIEWTVLLASGKGRDAQLDTLSFNLVERAWHFATRDEKQEREDLIRQEHFRIRRLVSPTDEMVDLTPSEQRQALDMTISEWEIDKEGHRPSRPSGPNIRRTRNPKRGLLMLYSIDGADKEKIEIDAVDIPVLGFAISFPYVADGDATRVMYEVNNVYWKQEFEQPQGELTV